MKNIKSDCISNLFCECNLNKTESCEQCLWYNFIDSGYGYCKALPTFVQVAWCRDICSLFKKRGEK